MQLKKIHYLSGLTLTLFIGLHLFNHFLSVFGADVHIDFMERARVIYRNPIVEGLLLIAVATQIFSGIKLFFGKRKLVSGFFEKLQVWTGLYLAVFLVIHISAVLGGRFVLDLDTNLYFGVAGLNTFPFNLFFVPYYGLAVVSFFGHIAGIHHQKMKRSIFGITVEQQSWFIFTKGMIVALVLLFGLTNGFSGFEIPEVYRVLVGG